LRAAWPRLPAGLERGRQQLRGVPAAQNTPDEVDGSGEVRTNTNFKLVRWDAIAESFDPRKP
jgi:hypothetical protein